MDEPKHPKHKPLLEVSGVGKTFGRRPLLARRAAGVVRALDGVTFALRDGEALGLLGESGSGKTTLARCIVGLECPDEGRIVFDGRRIDTLNRRARWHLGRKIQLVWQDPYAYLNPYARIGQSIVEPLLNYGERDHDRLRKRLAELLDWVGLPSAVGERYPHELSGGQCQRVVIARALALDPELLICDEPLSSLDVSTQVQLLALFRALQKERGLAYLFITHDSAQIRRLCSRAAVMFQGRLVEVTSTETLMASPAHPYTRKLMASATRLGAACRQAVEAYQHDDDHQQ